MTETITIVYRDITPAEAVVLAEHPKARASSWSDLMHERDDAKVALAAAEARNATLTDEVARVVGDMCARIKAADDAAADADYMLDSDDCIKVLRGQWDGAPKRGNPDWKPDPEKVAKVVDNLMAARAAASISTKGDGHGT